MQDWNNPDRPGIINRLGPGRSDGQDRALGRVDNRIKLLNAKRAEIRQRETTPLELFGPQPTVTRLLRQGRNLNQAGWPRARRG